MLMLLITKIDGKEYIFETPDVGDFDAEKIIEVVDNSCVSGNIEELKNYPFAKKRIFEQLYLLKTKAFNSSALDVSEEIQNEKNPNIVKFCLGMFKFCGNGRDAEDRDQLYFVFIIGKFMFKIMNFIDSYIKSNSKKR